MKKVVVERPRWASRQRNNKFGLRLRYIPDHDYDEQAKKARGFESYVGAYKKSFTDVLGPLERFLRKNVARPWTKVYSELSAGLDKRKATGKHIFDHVDDMVEKNCFIGDDGSVYAIRWGGERPVTGIYVHPRTGLLCEVSPRKRQRRRQQLDPNFLRVDDDLGYRKHNDICTA